MRNLYKKLLIVSAPSGCGKGTLLSKFLDEHENVWLSISATTRAPRAGEKYGINYFFTDKKTFEEEIKNGEFLEFAEYGGNYYGTPKSKIEEHLKAGELVILEIEVQGALQVMKKCQGCKSLFIAPPSLEELENRLRGRNTEGEEAISARMRAAGRELDMMDNYDKIIINDDLNQAYEQFCKYVTSI